MKKLIAILLLICMLTGLVACKRPKDDGKDKTDKTPTTSTGTETPGNNESTAPTIAVPDYKDYGRGSADFKNIVYSRPNIQGVINQFEAVMSEIQGDVVEISAQIENLRSLESPLAGVKTMYALVEINRSKNASVTYWHGEAEYFATYYPRLIQATERLIVACARSEHKEAFETDYFGYSIDEYVSGGIYTDEVVALMDTEARLENEFSSLSTATVEISYRRFGVDEPFTGTVDEVKAQLKEYFGNDLTAYNNVLPFIDNLYNQKRDELVEKIYVELIKVRRLIASGLGYESYTELAYSTLGYDYTEEDMLDLIGDVREYVYTVTDALTSEVFEGYEPPKVSIDRVTLMNTLYKTYSDMGGIYKDAYSYMLQHGLYDVAPNEENRYSGAFATYLETNSSPFIFVTTTGLMSDYTKVAHEFGHFLDGYINFGAEDTLSTMEVSSQAMELLTLLKLKGTIHTPEYRYLTYVTVSAYLYDVLLAQSFYAAFEHMAYALDYSEITAGKLEEVLNEAHALIYGESNLIFELSDVSVPQTVLYPCYVESYVVSALVSLDIFFLEMDNAGDGLALYEKLIDRDTAGLGFSERLAEAGISSPFTEGKVMDISRRIYKYLTGKDYLFSEENESAA